MELFSRRYFCLIAFAFVLTALLSICLSGVARLALSIIAVAAAIVCVIFLIKQKKKTIGPLFAAFLCGAIAISSFNSYFFIARAEAEASSLLGEKTVIVRVIHSIAEDEYKVELLQADESEVNIDAELLVEGAEKLEYGDILVLKGRLERAYDKSDLSKQISIVADLDKDIILSREPNKNYFSINGVISLCYDMREGFSSYLDGIFGEYGSIVRGLLINDKSDIAPEVKLDFRRAGVSHILAVSGLHISLLLGAIEILLRNIRVKKEIRIALISVIAIILLALTAFSASAVRSVIMLFAVYLNYIFSEENDPITSLFVAIAIIILFSPFSVYDLGMWMSFLATLGILSVYLPFEERLPYPRQENKLVRYTLKAILWCVKTMMLTVVANFFLLPIMWLFFGEASISAVPCNLIISPIITVLLPLCAFSSIVGGISYFGDAFVFLIQRLIDILLSVIEWFSSARFGVVSLAYGFAGILIILFAVSTAIMLVVRLKQKMTIFIPMAAFLLSFALCLTVVTLNSKAEVVYCKNYDSSVAIVNDGTHCSVIKLDDKGYTSSSVIVYNMSKYATEIDNYLTVSPSENDVKIINSLLKNTTIRKIYLPKTVDNEEYISSYEICKCAEKYNIEIMLFENDKGVEICNGVELAIDESKGSSISSSEASFSFCDGELKYFIGGEEQELGEAGIKRAVFPLE